MGFKIPELQEPIGGLILMKDESSISRIYDSTQGQYLISRHAYLLDLSLVIAVEHVYDWHSATGSIFYWLILLLFQNVARFDFSRFIVFVMHLDITKRPILWNGGSSSLITTETFLISDSNLLLPSISISYTYILRPKPLVEFNSPSIQKKSKPLLITSQVNDYQELLA